MDIKADATNPGGITATGASVVRHTKPTSDAPSKDRPITRFYGGIFNATFVVRQGGTWGAGYTGASAPYFYFYGGEFNGTIYTNRSQNQFYGGTFNGQLQMSVDSSAYTLITGGKFKYLSNMMGSDLDEKIAQGKDYYKFTIGTSKSVYDKAIYVDDEGYYVVADSKPAEEIEARVAMTPNEDNYFYYSEVATEGALNYTDVYMALENNKTATVTVYVDELDLEGSSFTSTIVVPEGKTLTVTNAPESVTFEGEGTVIIVEPVTTPIGSNSPAYTKEVDGYVRVWGEGGGNAKESFVLKLYSGETLIATTMLNNIGGIIDGDVYVTWNFYYPSSNDEYWTTTWEEGHPNSLAQPTKVELWIDGTCVATTPAKMSGADDLNPVNWEELGGVKYIVTDLQGSGTQSDPFIINNKAELEWFRDRVNDGNNYVGKYVLLNADIDLGNEAWAPIGSGSNPFKGVFDGQNHTISNLVIDGGSSSNIGFFGYTRDGEIKNLTINNAKVSGRLNVAVVAGTPYTSKFTNIKVTGHVEVNGMAYVGTVGGKNAYANWTDIVVDVDASSYVNANSVENGTAYRTYVGGVVGFNGEGGHTFKNISSNIKVIGSTMDIGGVFGIAHYSNKFENITFTGSVEAPADAKEVGGIAGVWHNQKGYTVTFTNVTSTGTVTVGDVTTTGSIVGDAYNADNETAENSGSLIIDGNEAWICAAKISNVKYATVAEAFAAAQNGDEVKIIVAGNYAVPTGKNITITAVVDGVTFGTIGAVNMNGANVTFNNVTFNYADKSSYNGLQHSGNLVYNNCTFNGQVFLYGESETFNNCIFNQTDADSYNAWTYTAKDVEFNKCTFNCAGKSVLIYAEGANVFNNVYVTDCEFIASTPVDGKSAIEMDSSLTAGINLVITNTTVTGFGTGSVSGNSLWNNKKNNNTAANNDITVVVDGETVLGPVTFVAMIGNIGYTTIASAIKAANGGTVVLVNDVTVDGYVTISKGENVTLDLNGHTITGTDITEKNFGLIQNNGTLTIKDTVGTGKISLTATVNSGWSRYSAVISNNPGATLIVNSGTIEHLGGTDMAYGIDSLTNGTLGDVNVTINGGTITSPYRAIRQFLNSATDENVLVINGGIITSTENGTAIFFHDPSTKANNGTITVKENATINGNIYLFVTEGSTEWPVEVAIAASALQGDSTVTSKNVPVSYAVEVTDGIYGVVEKVEEILDTEVLCSKGYVPSNYSGWGEAPYSILFAIGIDSLDYSVGGFEITINGVTKNFYINGTVWSSLTINDITYTPSQFGEGNNYIMYYIVTFDADMVQANPDITVRAFLKEIGGSEFIYSKTCTTTLVDEM